MRTEIESLISQSSLPIPLGENLVIYGIGSVGKEIAASLIKAGYQISAVLDSNASTIQSWMGFPVSTLDEWLQSNEPTRYTLIVTIHNLTFMPDLLANFSKCGFGRVINIVELYNFLPNLFRPLFWLTTREYYRPFLPLIDAASRLFSDHESRTWYDNVIAFRLTGNYSRLPAPTARDQYTPSGLPRWANPLRLIDCGAYTGDSILHFMHEGYEFESIAAFEPDLGNFHKLARNLEKLALDNTTAFPCGLGSETNQQRFLSTGGILSRNSPEGDTIIQVVSLDDALPGFSPNLIKIDIEGAEIDALCGARKTISKHLPALAIAVYHHPSHIWQIPLLVAGWGLNYRLFLRGHAHNSYELVLYALPPEDNGGSRQLGRTP